MDLNDAVGGITRMRCVPMGPPDGLIIDPDAAGEESSTVSPQPAGVPYRK
jgi:hypothetical protein